ncbi:cell wall metabolism sensor histidine kinase WalK [Nostocoides sp. HKS02]|uniref:sensor histidine kinase n=1 Tax=Nostocoides sp. HKS02 TaxID=1813880 RepID=UPI0012B492A5|nr:ATP-binding protein [Tetrasphaera sp. HKS02]QGN57923.1 GAF domain-containing protein [Tetrasphaera sp. HKS02]
MISKFAVFRQANRALSEQIRVDRDEARLGSRLSIEVVAGVVVLTALLAMAIVLSGWRLLEASVSRPLAELRTVLEKHRDGDRSVQADTGTGASEVRALAADFNGLTNANQVLQDQQGLVMLSQQLALDVARAVHTADDVDHAMQLVCAMLGEGLSADRVLLYIHDETGHIEERNQWRRYDLPALPPLPPSLAQQVRSVSDELRRSVAVYAASDFLAPDIQQDERSQGFYRATGARSLLLLPVGVGDQGIGVLALMMVDGPRRWRRYEIHAAQECAGYAAQTIASLRLREMQEVQVHQLRELDRQKTDFMATVSHELRTPLTSISGYLELLEDGDYGGLSGPQHAALGIIDRNTTRLRGLIEDLLVLNKIEATGLKSEVEDVSVASLVAGVVELLRPVAEDGDVELVMGDIDPDLVIRVDRNQLERSLINLGSNAVKFTAAGGRASLAACEDGDRIVIEVADTGIGIPTQDQQRLFDRFFRASNATDAAIPGTGLGLAIVRAIVEGHGGELSVESVEGAGTTMRVLLPKAPTAGNDPPPAAV